MQNFHRLIAVGCCLSLLCFTAPATWAQTGIDVPNCYVGLIEDIELPAEAPGVVKELSAFEGMQVKKDEPLGHLGDAQAKAKYRLAEFELRSAKMQAEDDIKVRYARAETDVTQAELDAAKAARQRQAGAVSDAEFRRLELQVDRSKLGIEQAQLGQNLLVFAAHSAAASISIAEDEIRIRQITAPLDGTVVEVRRHVGEWVDPGETILRIVRMDRLSIEGFLNNREHGRERLTGREVVAEVDLGRGKSQTVRGKITFVSPLIQAGGDYRVRAEVENVRQADGWLLQPGQSATLRISGAR